MDEEELNFLEDIAEREFRCTNLKCCEYLKYDQCFNHSHVLCKTFESYYDALNKNRNI